MSGLPVIVLALAVVLVGCWQLYQREAGQIADRQAQVEVVRVRLLAQLLSTALRPIPEDLAQLEEGDGFQGYLGSHKDADLQAAIRQARQLSAAIPAYEQIRYLDQTGQEIFRVNQGGAVVAATQLQNKADRDYFVQANSLAAGGLYVSAFDLNIEHGQVEMPLKPMLRFAIAVFDASGARRGIYIINYLGAGVIDRLQHAAGTAGRRVRLLDANGYWLKGSKPEEEWGFALPGRSQITLAHTDPKLWAQIQAGSAGQARGDNGLFTWQRLPIAEIAEVPASNLKSAYPFLIVASAIQGPQWAVLFESVQQVMWILTAGLLLLIGVTAWLLRERLRAARNLRDANEQLEERVHARTEELAQSNEQLRYRELLLEETGTLAKVGGWDFDPKTGDGRWTNEIAHIHDVEPTLEPNKQYGLQFYPGESRVQLEAALQEAVTKGTPYDLELEFISARGVHKWVRTIARPIMQDGKVSRMRGALQDVTDRKESELRLRAQLQRLRLLEETTRAIGERQDLGSILQIVIRTLEEDLPLDFGCICTYDAVDRSLTVAAVGVANMALAEQLAMTEKARIPIDQNGLSRCVRGQLVYEPDIEGLDFDFPRRLLAGGLRCLVAAPLQFESRVFGVLIGARRLPKSFSSGECEFIRQLSEHVALAARQAQLHQELQDAYDDLRNSQQTLLQQERLRVLGQMASGIAHDINNAISPITLYTDSLLEGEPNLSDRAREFLETIQQAAGDVAETVARLREFYRQREVQAELHAVDINGIAAQVVDLTRARWQTMPQERGTVINLVTELTPELSPVDGIESELREALINLVFNAVDAMPSGGTLTLRTRPCDDHRVCVEVVDTGVGMDEDTRRRCLEPFFTTKGERGTGLGLGMVYGVMQRHGGDIEIESSPGVGTTMRLVFAIAEDRKDEAQPPLKVPTGLSILLIDDDPSLLKSVREVLAHDGHNVLTANGGQAGVALFQSSLGKQDSARIDAVITDLGMPHVDGRTVARAVKRMSSSTPVIMLTGWGERLLAEGDTPQDVDRVLSKPPRLRELRRALGELVTQE